MPAARTDLRQTKSVKNGLGRQPLFGWSVCHLPSNTWEKAARHHSITSALAKWSTTYSLTIFIVTVRERYSMPPLCECNVSAPSCPPNDSEINNTTKRHADVLFDGQRLASPTVSPLKVTRWLATELHAHVKRASLVGRKHPVTQGHT